MTTETTGLQAQVMGVLDRQADALRNKDLDALAACYADGVLVFDIGAQTTGYSKLRELWESCFPYFPNPIETYRKDLQITAGAEVAVATYLSRLTGMETDHPSARSWIRTTMCLQKRDDQWKIIHEHASFPVDCGAEKPTYIFDEPPG